MAPMPLTPILDWTQYYKTLPFKRSYFSNNYWIWYQSCVFPPGFVRGVCSWRSPLTLPLPSFTKILCVVGLWTLALRYLILIFLDIFFFYCANKHSTRASWHLHVRPEHLRVRTGITSCDMYKLFFFYLVRQSIAACEQVITLCVIAFACAT